MKKQGQTEYLTCPERIEITTNNSSHPIYKAIPSAIRNTVAL